ncbi:hypothetical protein SAMN05216188_11983 [Lentzea xinjiangensis]|uniref:Uncharacterized protein n=1 Tax=Lentzea xinjiangensis TaxID=402600 RepID=A0A1H9TV95_9PSEU|nr:hypothetical protein SAMN05216188_11983 [Lentzea xinjiangensis]
MPGRTRGRGGVRCCRSPTRPPGRTGRCSPRRPRRNPARRCAGRCGPGRPHAAGSASSPRWSPCHGRPGSAVRCATVPGTPPGRPPRPGRDHAPPRGPAPAPTAPTAGRARRNYSGHRRPPRAATAPAWWTDPTDPALHPHRVILSHRLPLCHLYGDRSRPSAYRQSPCWAVGGDAAGGGDVGEEHRCLRGRRCSAAVLSPLNPATATMPTAPVRPGRRWFGTTVSVAKSSAPKTPTASSPRPTSSARPDRPRPPRGASKPRMTSRPDRSREQSCRRHSGAAPPHRSGGARWSHRCCARR